ncbi:MAG: response regulator [Rhodospirillaceae bacterium]|nr:response regulator [Rhodospirillaceae bacterium]
MEDGYDIQRLNFLIVDDNKHMCMLVKGIINALGSKNTVEAGDGADAFKELRHFPADIIICDWNMDPLDGLDFTRMVRTGSDSPNPFVPIIMLTGFTEMNRVVEARDAGVSEFLAKPISARGLYSRIRSIIERPRPFVRAGMFFGPDRRRNDLATYMGKERRKKAGEEGELSQDSVDSMFD